MDEKLKVLMEKQEQLRAMKQSVSDFEAALNKEFAEFLESELKVKPTATTSIIELLGKARSL